MNGRRVLCSRGACESPVTFPLPGFNEVRGDRSCSSEETGWENEAIGLLTYSGVPLV